MTDQTQEERHLGAESLGQRTKDQVAEKVIAELLVGLREARDFIDNYDGDQDISIILEKLDAALSKYSGAGKP